MKPSIISRIRIALGIAGALVCFGTASAAAQIILPFDTLILPDTGTVVGRLEVKGTVSIREPLVFVADVGIVGPGDSTVVPFVRPAAGAVVRVSECRQVFLDGIGSDGCIGISSFDTLQSFSVIADSLGNYVFETFGFGAPDSSLYLLYDVEAADAVPYHDMILKYSGEASQHDMVLTSTDGTFSQGWAGLHGRVGTPCREPDSGQFHTGGITPIPACTVVVCPAIISIMTASDTSAVEAPVLMAITDSLGGFHFDSIPFSCISGFFPSASFDIMANKAGWGFGRLSVLLRDGVCDTVNLSLTDAPIELSDDGLTILDTDIWKIAQSDISHPSRPCRRCEHRGDVACRCRGSFTLPAPVWSALCRGLCTQRAESSEERFPHGTIGDARSFTRAVHPAGYCPDCCSRIQRLGPPHAERALSISWALCTRESGAR